MPRYVGGRFILSSCDAVWDAVDALPQELRQYFTDELGNKAVHYGGFLQMVDPTVLSLLSNHGLFACFRCVSNTYLEYVQVCQPDSMYQGMIETLRPAGWDIVTGNGWLSASCHGCFPINPFTGDAMDQNSDKVNEYGLFGDLDDCVSYCVTNDNLIPEHAPWFPVAIYLDDDSFRRLTPPE